MENIGCHDFDHVMALINVTIVLLLISATIKRLNKT